MGRVVGIDLGTSTSEISILVEGKPYVIPNKTGETIIPSVVGMNDEGEIVVGKEAKEQLLLKPEDTVMEVKRLMGSNEKVVMCGKEFSPQEISAFLLKYLVEYASEHLDEKIERAVITVPAYFTDAQRRATVEAGKLAGIKVERIINEPTAASLDYGIDHLSECKNIMVYDLGGGTLDVTVLEMFEGVMEVRASSGNNQLGGKDLDEILMNYLLEEFKKKHNVNVELTVRARMRLKEEAEKCKIALSTQEEYNVEIPFFVNIDNIPFALEARITRDIFEELVCSVIDSTTEQMNVSLRDAGLKANEIDLVILVGGSTRIPYVKKLVGKVMECIPGVLLDPDMAVARGAGIQAAILNNEMDEDKDIMITDVCPYTLGISILGEIGGVVSDDIFDIIIPRNITIPVNREKIYGTCEDYQTAVEVKVYQGEYKKASGNHFLGSFLIEGIPERPAFKEKVKVAFSYDVNGILNVEATIVSTGERAHITVATAGSEMMQEVDLSLWKDKPNARKYRALINKAGRVLNGGLAGDQALDLDELIKDIKTALVEEEKEDILEEIKEELEEFLFDLEEEEDE